MHGNLSLVLLINHISSGSPASFTESRGGGEAHLHEEQLLSALLAFPHLEKSPSLFPPALVVAVL